jgi:hypothetical protein
MPRILRAFLAIGLSQENKGKIIEWQNDLFGKLNYFALNHFAFQA